MAHSPTAGADAADIDGAAASGGPRPGGTTGSPGDQILRPLGALHGDCFYLSLCEPLDDTERRIREPAD